MRKELEDVWDEAAENPGRAVPIGRSVCCDSCSKDFTDSNRSGGMIFQSKAICPDCEQSWRENAHRYGELSYIKAACPAGQSFADFVRDFRGPDAFVRISLGEKVDG